MSWPKKNLLENLLIITLFLIGIHYRFQGISTNHSFWADESLVSSISREIAQGEIGLFDGIRRIPYQSLQIGTVALSFKLFDISEWSARLPSVIWGSVGIIFAYLLAKRYSNKWGGFLAALFYTFLQLNLAYATQAKPYAAIEALFLISLFFAEKNILIALLSALLATLYNYIGLISIIPIILSSTKYIKKEIPLKYILKLSVVTFIILLVFFIKLSSKYLLFPQYNWFTFSRELFWRQFAFLTLPALFGLFLMKNNKILLGIAFSVSLLLYYWNFVFYSHNIRYLMPIFGILTVLFGIFWGKIGESVYKKPGMVCLTVALLIIAGGYKVVRKPYIYYTPNADFFADVQNADYKTFFAETYKKFPDFDNYTVLSDLYDPFAWYSNKKPDALFMRVVSTPTRYDHYPVMVYPSLDYFLTEMSKHSQGFVFVEDWHSFLPDDIKEYVKKNLKREIRIESMAVSPDDKWPLELYSWGFDDKK